MIERKRLLSLGYYDFKYEHITFSGSDGDKRYQVERLVHEDVHEELDEATGEKKEVKTSYKTFLATIWRGPLCFEKTPDEAKITHEEDFTEDGLCRIVDWMNETSV